MSTCPTHTCSAKCAIFIETMLFLREPRLSFGCPYLTSDTKSKQN